MSLMTSELLDPVAFPVIFFPVGLDNTDHFFKTLLSLVPP